jgi:predicted ATPase
MLLSNAEVKSFKSIENSGEVIIDPKVTILVGQNESGKTAFLQALHKSASVEPNVKFNITEDYPRKNLNAYEREHTSNPAVVTELTYTLNKEEISLINSDLGFELFSNFSFTLYYKYNNRSTVSITVPEKAFVTNLVNNSGLTVEKKEAVSKSDSIRKLIKELEDLDLNGEENDFLESLKAKFTENENWHSVLSLYIWTKHINPRIPQFLYFDDYRVLPGKINLPELQRKVEASKTDPSILKDEDKTALSLLNMAGVELADLNNSSGYENIKAKLEAISNSITDKVFEYWRQNQELDVEFDIRQDPNDQAPYNNGNNLYIRIKNRRHRVTVPFNQRSKGFIWFFSFIVWFDSIKEQMKTKRDLILLLDEPGLSLHALAQADFLYYIDDLTKNHQIIYTTHSPFMVPNDLLHQVRMVEDKLRDGTKVTSNISSSDPKTLFPLQAALGYTIAQNLFISKKNLLVEGPADLIYLKFFSAFLESKSKTYLSPEITIIPAGGLDKLVTFIALLGGNELDIAVLHDYNSKPDPRIDSLVKEKIISGKYVLNYAQFRTSKNSSLQSSDVEDMISSKLYLSLFNSAYSKELCGQEILESELPEGERIVDRINRYLKSKSITLRPSGGFNHYLIANHLAAKPPAPSKIDAKTIERFEALFVRINSLLDG